MSYLTGEPTPTNNADPQAQPFSPPQENWLEKVVKEKGEAWSDPQTLAKGYASSQEYIASLETQAAELREELGKAKYAEEVLSKMKVGQEPTPKEPTPSHTNNTGATSTENTTPIPSMDDLKSLINETLTQKEIDNTKAQNLAHAEAELTKLFGTEVEAEMNKRSKELGMQREQLIALAGESPTAFLKLIGSEGQVQRETNSNFSSTSLPVGGFNNGSVIKNNSYYQELRRKDSRKYFEPKMQQEVLESRKRLGDKFWT